MYQQLKGGEMCQKTSKYFQAKSHVGCQMHKYHAAFSILGRNAP